MTLFVGHQKPPYRGKKAIFALLGQYRSQRVILFFLSRSLGVFKYKYLES